MTRKIPLHLQIFIGMATGAVSGVVIKQFNLSEAVLTTIGNIVKPVGDIFLRMIFMMVIPLILSALTLGIAELGDLRKIGRIGLKMILYTLIVSSIAVMIGVGAVNIFQPGGNLKEADRLYLTTRFMDKSTAIAQGLEANRSRTFGDVIAGIVPKNPLEDMTRAFDPTYTGGGLLSVMFLALIIGIALSSLEPSRVQTFKSFLEGLYEIVMKVIGYGMRLAPFGVASLLFLMTLNLGASILHVLIGYVLLVLGALAIHLFVTYSIILWFFAKINPFQFFKHIRDAMVTAFSTSSSNATLPTAIRVTIDNVKVPRDVTHFVLTIGSTANQNGTALYEGITVLFLAQCFGVDLSVSTQIMVVFMCILAGVGTAGVPGGSLPVVMLILTSIGVPGESIALIYGVDRILDMSRTVLNVTGDIVAATYIYQSENTRVNKRLTSTSPR